GVAAGAQVDVQVGQAAVRDAAGPHVQASQGGGRQGTALGSGAPRIVHVQGIGAIAHDGQRPLDVVQDAVVRRRRLETPNVDCVDAASGVDRRHRPRGDVGQADEVIVIAAVNHDRGGEDLTADGDDAASVRVGCGLRVIGLDQYGRAGGDHASGGQNHVVAYQQAYRALARTNAR